MNDQEQCEPLSFKGQMAARYRERMSMGFNLANDNTGDDFSAGPSVAATLSDAPGSLVRHGVFRAADQTIDAGDTPTNASHNVAATTGLPTAVRSKSSLGDNQAIAPKPTMKDLITKFETRFFTSTQLRQNTEADGEKHRIARDAWGSSCPRIKLELDPSAMTSSSSSDVVDSKSSLTLSKPPYAKTSRANLSLNHDTNKRLQMLQCLNRPRSRLSVSNTPEKLGGQNHLNLTNSHQSSTDNQKMNTENQPGADNSEEARLTQEDTTNTSGIASNKEPLPDKAEKMEKEVKQNSDEQESPAAVRVNLREFAQRRKNIAENKYIVHTKDWGKRISKKDTTNSSLDVATFESTTHNISTSMENDKDSTLKDFKSKTTQDVYKGDVHKIKQNISSPHLPYAISKADVRSRSRQSDRSDDSKDLTREQHTKAMERYLQFLRSSNPPPMNPATNDVKAEKTDLRKASRPPTPQRANKLHKGSSSSVFRNSLHPFRETNQSTGGMQEISRLTNKTDRDVRLEQMLLRRPRSRQSLTMEKKDMILESSGGDFMVTPTISSTNSDDAGDCSNKLNTGYRFKQLKTGSPDTGLIRQVPTNKHSKLSTLPGRNSAARKLPKTMHPRPQSARTHEASDKKQLKQVPSHLRTRSSSANKSLGPKVSTKKASSLFSSSKSVISVASPNSLEAKHRISPAFRIKTGRELKHPTYDAPDSGSFLLTEDELADNDLVPVHLRERKPRDLSGQRSLVPSSSDDSQNARPLCKFEGSQLKKLADGALEKRMLNLPEIIDRMEPQCFDDEARSTGKAAFSGDESKYSKHLLQEKIPIEDNNRFFVLHGKKRSTSSKFVDYPTDDLIRNRTTTMHHSRPHNTHLTSQAGLGRPSDLSNTQTGKETRDIQEGPNLTSNVVPDERKAGYVTRDGRDTRLYEQFRSMPDPPITSARGDNLHSPGQSSVEKALMYIRDKPVEPAKGSPSKKTTQQKATGHHSGVMKEHSRDRKGEVNGELNMLMSELPLRGRDSAQRMMENMQNSFHFGHTHEKDEAYFGAETKSEKTPAASPQKKKRKSDQPKKQGKKKKKLEAITDDVIGHTGTLVSPQLLHDGFVMKGRKSKLKDSNKKSEDTADRMDRGDKSDMFEQPTRRRSSGELSVKTLLLPKQRKDSSQTWSSRKMTSRENSPSSAFSDDGLSPKQAFCTPDKGSIKNASSLPSMTQCLVPVVRLTGEPTDRFPIKSHIPLIISTAPRSKLDKLTQYRRWREALLDSMRPSRLPLSETFRKTLDAAVMEEWALHCWQPAKDMYQDSQGVWWSASYQDVRGGGVSESLLGDGSLFSKEGLLDFTARLPYMKVGPLRFLHATYVLMAVACITLGHMGARLYHCGGEDYEYFCQDDDIECLMQLFAHTR